MPKGKQTGEEVAEAPFEESTEDSNAYTEQRIKDAQERLEVQQDQARQQFVFLGEPEPEIDIPAPEDRPIDTDNMREDEVRALETQNAIASPDYTPRNYHDYLEETRDSPDINPEAKEFQLPASGEPDEFTGPEAAAKASATGYNPRTVATSTNPDDLVQEGTDHKKALRTVEGLTGRSADEIREEQGGAEDSDDPNSREGRASVSSTEDAPDKIEK